MMDDSGIDSDTTKRHKTTVEENGINSDEDSNTSDCSMRVTKPSFFQKKLGKSINQLTINILFYLLLYIFIVEKHPILFLFLYILFRFSFMFL